MEKDVVKQVVAVSPSGEIDVVNEKTRAFLNLARQRYVPGDTSFSVKEDDTLGYLPTAATFVWKIDDGLAVKRVIVQCGEDAFFGEFTAFEACTSFDESTSFDASAGDGDELILDAFPETDSAAVYNLKTGTTYYWRVAATLESGETVFSEPLSFRTKTGPRVLAIGDVRTARDTGGWLTLDGKMVPLGRVFRTSSLDHPDENGRKYLLEDLGIRTELDLRTDEKDSVHPVFTEVLNYINVPDAPGYTNFFGKPEVIARIMRVFAREENYPVVVHCAEGADRTGLVMFLLNALCGVGEIDLVCDYELSARRFRDGSHTPEHVFNFPAFIKAFSEYPGATPEEKARAFLTQDCGMTEEELGRIVAFRME